MFKKILTIIIALFSIVTTSKFRGTKLPNEDFIPVINTINSNTSNYKSAILIEASTKTVLSEENSDIKLPMASMTKVMSLILFFEAIEEKRLNITKELTCSEYASSMGGSQIFLSVGERMSVDDLLKSVCIASANDATVVLAEAISGSEVGFVTLMNNKAKELGLKNTKFDNCTGLPTNKEHYTSSYDMAIMSSYLINNYPKVLEYSSKYEDYVRVGTPKQFWLVNTNKLVKSVNGIDGLKTGWTNEAGYCITSTMVQDGMRLIAVVMGAKTVDDRTNKVISLFNYGYSNYKYKVLLPKNTVVSVNKNVLLSPTKQSIVLKEDFGIILKKDEDIKDFQTRLSVNNKLISNYETDNIGTAEFYKDGRFLGSVNLCIKEKITKNSFFELYKEVLKSIFIY
ncbi:MAG: D-alanyl-D-alanine carboxypeptidase [Bacilli bacterium]|nr:D-alanyl-D-alanine carboxypeptidase [Bacilli bacterium]